MSVWTCDATSVVYEASVWAMNSTSSVACMSCGREIVGSCGERNVAMSDCVVDSKRARRMRGVSG